MAVQRFVYQPNGDIGPSEARRFACWMDEFASQGNKRDVAFYDDSPLSMTYEVFTLGGGALVSRTAGSLRRSERRSEHARRNCDGPFVFLLNCATSPSFAETGTRSADVEPGSAVLFDCAQQSIHTYSRGHRTLALKIPRHRLIGVVRCAPDLHATVVPAGNDALRLFRYYIEGAIKTGIGEPPVVAQVSRNLLDLVGLALGIDGDNAAVARLRGLRAGRLAAILRIIRTDHADPEISPEAVARRVGISARSLHDLLHETGSSFTERVQELRLAKALSLLRSAGAAPGKISDTAYEAGFSDLSHFNRLFRRRYGMTPTAARGGRDLFHR